MAVDVSIVIVHWNVPDLLRGCLESIEREQRRAALTSETIVVDVASPGGLDRDVVAAHPTVTFFEMEENRGYAAGCNVGISRASGSAVLLLNADVIVLPGALNALWEALHVSAHVGMVAPMLLNPDGSIQSVGYQFPGVANVVFDLFPLPGRLVESPLNVRMPMGDGAQPIKVDYALGAAMMASRALIDDIGLLDEAYVMYSEEIDWAKRSAVRDWTTLLVPAARMVHYGGVSTDQRSDAMHEALWMSRARYLERWGTRRQQRAVAAAVRIGTRVEVRRSNDVRRASNARIRARFAELSERGRGVE